MSGSVARARARRCVISAHTSDVPLSDGAIDAALGLDPERVEAGLQLGQLLVRYGGEHRVYAGDTSYPYVRRLFRLLDALRPRRIVDLGSGYGRILLYGALLWPRVRFHGIEMVAERVEEVRRVSGELKLDNVECVEGDVLNVPWPEGDCFCLMNSFTPSVLPTVVERLHGFARQRPYLLASAWTSNTVLSVQPWLTEVPQPGMRERILCVRLFRTL